MTLAKSCAVALIKAAFPASSLMLINGPEQIARYGLLAQRFVTALAYICRL